MRHQEDKQSKATSSLFLIEMIAKLEWTQSNAQQNIEQLQNPTMGITINKESTTATRNQQQQTASTILLCVSRESLPAYAISTNI